MSRILLLKDSELNLWDRFVQEHPFGWITHLSGWARMLKEAKVARHCLLLALLGDDGKIKAGLPLYPTFSYFIGLNYVSAPLSTVVDPLVSNDRELKLLLDRAVEIMTRAGGHQIVIKPLHTVKYFSSGPFRKSKDFRYHILDLSQPEEQIWKKLHRSCIRQHINRAYKAGLRVRKIERKVELPCFYRLYKMSRKNRGLPAIPLSYFQAIWDNFQKKENVHFFVAEWRGRAAASLMALSYKNTFSAEAMGWDPSIRWVSPAVPLFWETIKFARNKGFGFFDFGRTPADNQNLLSFKRHWGTEERELPVFVYPGNSLKEGNGFVRNGIFHFLRFAFRLSPRGLYELMSKIVYMSHVE